MVGGPRDGIVLHAVEGDQPKEITFVSMPHECETEHWLSATYKQAERQDERNLVYRIHAKVSA
jgi:hypothetical protein